MYTRVVGEYIKEEIERGKTIDQIRKRLLKSGYDKGDVNKVLRKFEYRECDLKDREDKLMSTRTRMYILLSIIFVVAIASASLSFYYFSNPSYILLKETPTGLITQTITKEELHNLEWNINQSNSSSGGLLKIT